MTVQERHIRASGGCLCGSVRYQIDGEVQFSGFCYCGDCRRVTGAGRVPFIGLKNDAVHISGELKTFSSQGGSGRRIDRAFCHACGGRLLARPSAVDGIVIIYAGTLDEPNGFQPRIGIHLGQRTAWEHASGDLLLFDGDVPD